MTTTLSTAMIILLILYLLAAITSNIRYVVVTALYLCLAVLAFVCHLMLAANMIVPGSVFAWLNIALFLCLIAGLNYIANGACARQPPEKLTWIVVLGCKLKHGRPGRALRSRLTAATNCYKEHPEAHIVVCGGQGADEVTTEAAAMAEYLVAHGVAESVITLEDTSTTTLENFANFLAITKDSSSPTAIVTSDFHLRRAMQLARIAGIENGYGVPGKTYTYKWLNGAVRELLCLAADKLGISGHDIRIAGKRL